MADNLGLALENLGVQAPYSMQAEQSVLGAALLDPSSIDIVMQRLRPEMFHVRQNRAVCTEIYTLTGNSMPVDIVVLAERLAAEGSFPSEAEARGYLADMADTVPSLSNLTHYISIVREKYVKRQLMEQAREILEQAGEDIDSDVMLEAAEQRLYELRSGRDTGEVQQLKYAIIDILSHLDKLAGPDRDQYLGIPTGYTYLDGKLAGLSRSDLLILASRPGMGKTSFALNIAVNVAKSGVPVVFFSLEMTNDQLAARILSAEARVDSNVFRTGVRENTGDMASIVHTSEALSPLPIYLDDTSSITVAEMKSRVRQLNRSAIATGKKPVGLIVIDYLQLMSSGKRNENRVQEISEMTRSLKIMAKDLDLPVLVLSQLSRNPEKGRADHRPMLSDLRDSGSIEQDADIVMFLYREAYYKDEDPDVDPNAAQCIIAKNRHGETGAVQMYWDGAHTQYKEIAYVDE